MHYFLPGKNIIWNEPVEPLHLPLINEAQLESSLSEDLLAEGKGRPAQLAYPKGLLLHQEIHHSLEVRYIIFRILL